MDGGNVGECREDGGSSFGESMRAGVGSFWECGGKDGESFEENGKPGGGGFGHWKTSFEVLEFRV